MGGLFGCGAANESGRIYVPRWLAEGDDNKSEVPPLVKVRMERLRLTRRQCEILPLLAQGMPNKEIARHLDIAEGTTKIHTAALLGALSARNRTEAASGCDSDRLERAFPIQRASAPCDSLEGW